MGVQIHPIHLGFDTSYVIKDEGAIMIDCGEPKKLKHFMQGIEKADRHRRVMKLLADVGLAGMEHRRPSQLSGGQQQRVAIARAIASDPAVVLADEPTANVDSQTADTLLSIMEQLNRSHGVTFLFSTHDPRVMERAKRLVRMVDGKVESDESKAD